MVYGGSVGNWRTKTVKQTWELRDKILRKSGSLKDGDDGLEIWRSVFALFFLCSFSGLYDHARDLLQAYFDAVPGFIPDHRLPEKRVLESIWTNAEETRPSNVPWTDGVAFDTTEWDIDNPAFYSMGWPNLFWSPETGMITDQSHIDPHGWRTSNDQYMHGWCARLLCRVPAGQVPDRAAVSEAFDALERVLAFPRQGGPGEPAMFRQIFEIEVYFSLAAGLGRLGPGKASEIFKLAEWEGGVHDLLPIPAFYRAFLGDSHKGQESVIDEAEAISAVETITRALQERMTKGPQEPLAGIGWADLLRRFSEAAFKVYADEYAELEDPPASASDILLPPITAEKLAETEERLGPLPPDMREMVQIANGFKGAWHLLGGGFAGVDKLHVRQCGNLDWNDHPWLADDLKGQEPLDGAEEAPMWCGEGAVESDDFEHYIYPPLTWRLVVGGDASVADGDYRVLYTSHWMDYQGDGWKSMRDWIASETVGMERQLALEDLGEGDEDGGE